MLISTFVIFLTITLLTDFQKDGVLNLIGIFLIVINLKMLSFKIVEVRSTLWESHASE